jgi:hypothetical protein
MPDMLLGGRRHDEMFAMAGCGEGQPCRHEAWGRCEGASARELRCGGLPASGRRWGRGTW